MKTSNMINIETAVNSIKKLINEGIPSYKAEPGSAGSIPYLELIVGITCIFAECAYAHAELDFMEGSSDMLNRNSKDFSNFYHKRLSELKERNPNGNKID